MKFRTNLFEYNDTERIADDSSKNNVGCSINGNKVALIGKKANIRSVLNNCFEFYNIQEDNDILLVNC